MAGNNDGRATQGDRLRAVFLFESPKLRNRHRWPMRNVPIRRDNRKKQEETKRASQSGEYIPYIHRAPTRLHGPLLDKLQNTDFPSQRSELLAAHVDTSASVSGMLSYSPPAGAGAKALLFKPTRDLPDETELWRVSMPTRIFNALSYAGLRTIGEIRNSTDSDLLSLPLCARRRSTSTRAFHPPVEKVGRPQAKVVVRTSRRGETKP
jgi:hypothetical protein